MFNKQNGIGLLELMLALAIIAMMMVAASKYYKSTQLANRVQSAVESMQILYAASERYVLDGGIYSSAGDLVADPLKSRGYLPQDFVGPWGSSIEAYKIDDTHLQARILYVPYEGYMNMKDKLLGQAFVKGINYGGTKETPGTLFIDMDKEL